jgi:class 3 adenylate cyclase
MKIAARRFLIRLPEGSTLPSVRRAIWRDRSAGRRPWRRECPATEFRAILDRFYKVASQAIFDHDGGVDKYVGDGIIALFFPMIAGERHAACGVEAARGILVATGHEDTAGAGLEPELPRRSLELKGKENVTEVVSLIVGATADVPA